MRHIRMHGLKQNGCLSRQSAVGLYFKFLIGYNGSGIAVRCGIRITKL